MVWVGLDEGAHHGIASEPGLFLIALSDTAYAPPRASKEQRLLSNGRLLVVPACPVCSVQLIYRQLHSILRNQGARSPQRCWLFFCPMGIGVWASGMMPGGAVAAAVRCRHLCRAQPTIKTSRPGKGSCVTRIAGPNGDAQLYER
jgi:hypothetical protein